jgi:hypothetical protein
MVCSCDRRSVCCAEPRCTCARRGTCKRAEAVLELRAVRGEQRGLLLADAPQQQHIGQRGVQVGAAELGLHMHMGRQRAGHHGTVRCASADAATPGRQAARPLTCTSLSTSPRASACAANTSCSSSSPRTAALAAAGACGGKPLPLSLLLLLQLLPASGCLRASTRCRGVLQEAGISAAARSMRPGATSSLA